MSKIEGVDSKEFLAKMRKDAGSAEANPKPAYAPKVTSAADILREQKAINDRYEKAIEASAAKAKHNEAGRVPTEGPRLMAEALSEYRANQVNNIEPYKEKAPTDLTNYRGWQPPAAPAAAPVAAPTEPAAPEPSPLRIPAAPSASHRNRLRARSVMQERREVDAANAGTTNPANVTFENPFKAYLMRYRQEQKVDPRTFLRSAWLGGTEAVKASGRNMTQTY